MPGGQRPRLMHKCCLRHSHSLRKVSYIPGTREEGQGDPPSASSASFATTGAFGQAINTERLWKESISDPSQWWDHKLAKRNSKYPDVEHRRTREAIWMDGPSNPPWVKSELIARAIGKAQLDDGSNFQVHHGAPGKDSRLLVKEHTGGRGSSCSTSRGHMREEIISIGPSTVPFLMEGGALNLLHKFDEQGIPVESFTYVKLLQRCIKVKDLAVGRQIHDHILQSEAQADNFVSNTLISMYSKCGSVVDARQVFDKLLKKNVFSWNSMIGGYIQHGCVKEAITLFRQMRREGLEPNRITYMSILNGCASPAALEYGKDMHLQANDSGFQYDVQVGTALVNMYAKCGSIRDARLVFDKMSKRDIIPWNAMIGSYAQHGLAEEAFDVYHHMQGVGLKPDQISFMSILKACASPAALERGKDVHAHIIASGFQGDIRVGNALVNMYAKCGSIEDARLVFDGMSKRDVISWTALIEGYAQHGHCVEAGEVFRQMQRAGLKPNQITYMSILNACACPTALEYGTEVHAHIIEAGFQSSVRVGTALINMYAKCGSVRDARLVFDKMVKRNVISWNTMIGTYAQHGYCEETFNMFYQMQREGLKANQITYLSILNACSSPAALERGQEVHAHMLDSGFHGDVCIGTALVNMYAKCGSIRDARVVFDEMSKRDIITWNAMIGSYAQHGHCEEAFEIFYQIWRVGLKPDQISFMSILKACSSPAALERGKHVHAHIIDAGYQSDVRVSNALINMYAKCGSIRHAQIVFDKMANRNIISWTTLIEAYAQNGHCEDAFEVFRQIQQVGLKPENITYKSILNACTNPTALERGKEVHAHIIKARIQSDVFVSNALINMYAKCGNIEDARLVFDEMGKRDIISWNIMIGAYAQHDHCEEGMEIFRQIQRVGLKPDQITYLSILNACACPTALEHGKEVHAHIIDAEFQSDVLVCNALINMYAKCGSIRDALQVFDEMPKRDILSWNAMITGLALGGSGQVALHLFEQMKKKGVRPDPVTFVGVLSACSHAGLVDEGRHYFNAMSQDHDILPTIVHYGCFVDLLGRAGHLDEAENVIKSMPLEANAAVWGALLSACKLHGNVMLAEQAADCSLKIEPQNAAVYVLLSHVYAAAGMWDSVSKVRNLMKDRGVVKQPGRSWIEVDKKVHSFVAEDRSHPEAEEIYAELKSLTRKMKKAGYVPNTQLVMHEMDEQKKEEALCHHSEKLAIAYGLIRSPSGTTIRISKNLRVCADCHTATKFITKIVGREIIARDASRFHHFKDGLCSCGDYW